MSSSMNTATDLSKKYQQKTDKEHILDNPDTYIGSVEKTEATLWVFDDATKKMSLKPIHYNPGLYKLFDEAIVNARDHVIRMIQNTSPDKKCVTYISITITEDGTITITNDGNGIDVAKHPETGKWIPHMVFGELRTSTNFDKTEERIVGGKNGFGFKLVLIWSTYGHVETVDHTRGLKYIQDFHRNLDQIDAPVITKCSSAKPYTKVTFRPDYARLGIPGLDADTIAVLKKRIYDIAAITDHSVKKIKVTYNDEIIPVKNFQQYVDFFIGGKDETKRLYESANERWEYAVALSPTHEFSQVSYVNGICTFKGGKHVDYIVGQILRKLCEFIEKKKKIKVNPNSIKEQLILFLRCDIVNPSFDSQTKDYMNTPIGKFGSSCTVSDAFIEKIAKMGVMDIACSITEAKESRLSKKTDGTKTKSIRGIANFIDANHSGTAASQNCILILCEGLSAMSGIISGLSTNDRDIIGVYPLKGKLLNVRGEQTKKITENKEISDIKKIMGLESGRQYTNISDVHQHLRYGKILIVTDQDLDGSHIKGLIINAFHSEWASLIRIPGFLAFMNTPILRAKRGSQTLLFYNDGEYHDWKMTLGPQGTHGWTIKYFKGLGTSTSAEFKEYFANKKIVDFIYSEQSDDCIDKVFNKKRPDDRKTWLEQYDKRAFLNTNSPSVLYENFIDQEMIHFSTYNCNRSIPNVVDGMKTCLRKILYSAFKRKLTTEIKVAQFSGYVSEHSSYHHGEASLNGAIVHMAQNFVGSNNIHLLEPNGQFGTRLHGGDDSASERYIFTKLNPLTRFIFPEADDAILDYLNDDGEMVEPEFYVPIIPFSLVNGISGIGTGFSCNIPSYNPKQIIAYLKSKLTVAINTTEPDPIDFVPYYEGFNGTITKMGDQRFLVKGCYTKIGDDRIRITELPIGTWTMPYTSILEGFMDTGAVDKTGKKIPAIIKDFTSKCTEVAVDFDIQFPKGKLAELESNVDDNGINGVEKALKLTTTISTTNMYMFNANCQLHKYTSVNEIIDSFYDVRIDTYAKRKAHLMAELEKRLVLLNNRARYIQGHLNDTIDLRRKTSEEVTLLLTQMDFDKIDGDYKYLVKMPMDSVTRENVEKIMKECKDAEKELAVLSATTLETMWLNELTILEMEYDKFKIHREKIQCQPSSISGGGSNNGKSIKPKKKVVVKTATHQTTSNT
jgi:DNA topoisomerase-2